MPSGTMLGDRYAIRVAHVNHRTRDADFTTLLRASSQLDASWSGSAPDSAAAGLAHVRCVQGCRPAPGPPIMW
jgi:hypothetical protein